LQANATIVVGSAGHHLLGGADAAGGGKAAGGDNEREDIYAKFEVITELNGE